MRIIAYFILSCLLIAMIGDIDFANNVVYKKDNKKSNSDYKFELLNPHPTGSTIYDLEYKPDGSYALLVGDGGTVIKYDGVNFYPLKNNTHSYLSNIRWKKDGSYAVIVGQYFISKYDGTKYFDNIKTDYYYIDDLEWKTDGSYALIATWWEGDIAKYDGSAINKIFSNNRYGFYDIAWKPNDEYALIIGDYYNETYDKVGSVVMKYDGTTLTEIYNITTKLSLNGIDWKLDGSLALIVGGNYTIDWYMIYNGTTFKDLTPTANILIPEKVQWCQSYAFILCYNKTKAVKYDGTSLTELQCTLPDVELWDIYGMDWSNAGYLLLAGYNGLILKFDGSAFTKLSTGMNNYIHDIDWYKDGSYSIVLTKDKILRYDGKSFLTLKDGLSASSFSWKPNYETALITAYTEVYEYNSTTASIQLLKTPDVSLTNSVWHPIEAYAILTGYYFSPQTYEYKGIVYKYENNVFTELKNDTEISYYSFAWKPNGSYGILFAYDWHAGQTNLLKFDGKTFTTVLSTADSLSGSIWSDDGTYAIFYGSDRFGYNAYKFDGNTLNKIDYNFEEAICDASFIPGTSKVILVGSSGYIWELNGTKVKILDVGFGIPILYKISWRPKTPYCYIGGSGGTLLKLTPPNRAPLIKISSPTGEYYTKDIIVFNATDSFDPDYDNITFYWVSDIDGYLGNQTFFERRLSEGLHKITLYIDDGNYNSSTSIFIRVLNSPPDVIVSSPLNGSIYNSSELIEFNSSLTTDFDSDLLSFYWLSNISGNIGTSASFTTRLKFGEHAITLFVNDGSYNISKTINITILNSPPTPIITSPKEGSKFNSTDSIFFDGTNTTDIDNDVISITWFSSIRGYIGSGKSFYKQLPQGEHKIVLYADDGKHNVSAVVNITVMNSPPTVVIKSPKANAVFDSDKSIHFSVSAIDIDNDKLTYYWTSNISGFLSKADKFDSKLKFGMHKITVYVNDGKHNVSASVNITVNNMPPKIEIVSPKDGSSFFSDEIINFSVSAEDLDNDELSYYWESDLSGKIGEEEEIKSKLQVGTHKITVYVNDGINNVSSSITITIKNSKPSVSIIYPKNNAKVSKKITIKGNANDKDGKLVKVEISIAGSTWKEVNGKENWTYKWDTTKVENGDYLISVRAYDGTDYSDITTINLKVNNEKGFIPGFDMIIIIIGLITIAIIGRRIN
ncbi:MAG: Ig-like domain-containing protein [Candidatus Thermoplasmatota archaeon]